MSTLIQKNKRGRRWLGIVLILMMMGVVRICAEQLPIRTYTTANGLARDTVYKIISDPRGFLWFCTSEGLSRFDGYEFTNYGIADGLPHRVVNDLLITRKGDYWLATPVGVVRFAAASSKSDASRFTVLRPSDRPGAEHASLLYEDQTETIWVGTARGLYRLREVQRSWQFEFVDVGREKERDETWVQGIAEDSPGVLWIAMRNGLYLRGLDGSAKHFTTQNGLPTNNVGVLLKDRDGTLWAGTSQGLCHLINNQVSRVYSKKDGLLSNHIYALIRSWNGRLLVSTSLGLLEFFPEPLPGGGHFLNYTREHGFSDLTTISMAEDRDGNLWLGTESGGAMKLTRHGFISYAEVDGLEHGRIAALGEDRDGTLYVVTGSVRNQSHYLNQFEGRRFKATRINLPPGVIRTWGWYQLLVQDRIGEWWVPTNHGLYRFSAVKSLEQLAVAQPRAVYTTREGLGGDELFRLFEDSRGDIWISPGSGIILKAPNGTTCRLLIIDNTGALQVLPTACP